MVNTFIPFGSPVQCAKVLDNKRLGKQRVEAYQIINILTNQTKTTGWRNHPAVLMWVGYENALCHYYNCIVKEWVRRGFKNQMKLYEVKKPVQMPWFVKNKFVNWSYQASLLRKNHEHYKRFFKVPKKYMEYSYIWPSRLTAEQIHELKTSNVINIHLYALRI